MLSKIGHIDLCLPPRPQQAEVYSKYFFVRPKNRHRLQTSDCIYLSHFLPSPPPPWIVVDEVGLACTHQCHDSNVITNNVSWAATTKTAKSNILIYLHPHPLPPSVQISTAFRNFWGKKLNAVLETWSWTWSQSYKYFKRKFYSMLIFKHYDWLKIWVANQNA